MGGAYSVFCCLSRLIMNHAYRSGRSTLGKGRGGCSVVVCCWCFVETIDSIDKKKHADNAPQFYEQTSYIE